MSTFDFVQTFNPKSKEMEWKVVDENYDYHSEIAVSCYGDMLHDEERNEKFGAALKKAIDKVHRRGEKANVLDIGTGTGLLAMLACRHGADLVIACEAFRPVADCATRITRDNGFADKIKIVYKHSTDLTVGPGCDLPYRMNILVSEVFDTELIGEGAIKTFNHAHEFLLEKQCMVIPSAATTYAQVIESSIVKRWNTIEDWSLGQDINLEVPENVKHCPGVSSLHDIQLSQLPISDFIPLSAPVKMFQFDFSGGAIIPKNQENTIISKALNSGVTQAVFMWWDLKMDDEGEILLSCAPVWHHPDAINTPIDGNPAANIPWRDHWMQAVYFLQNEKRIQQGEEMKICGWHDEFSLWFAVNESECISPPACHCGVHVVASRTRIGAINDPLRRRAYASSLSNIAQDKVFVFVGDFSLLGLAAAKMGAKRVYILIKLLTTTTKLALQSFIKFNNLEKVVTLCTDLKCIVNDINSFCYDSKDVWKNVCIIGEPFFQTSLLAWENSYIWNEKEDLLAQASEFVNREWVTSFPRKMILKACCVQFDDLWKIRRPLGSLMGLNMTLFDKLISDAKQYAQSSPEPQPLWEYPCRAQSEVKSLLALDMNEKLPEDVIKTSTIFSLNDATRVDGIAVWAEYELLNGEQIQTGPISRVKIGEYLKWDRFERQGVHLYQNPFYSSEKISLECLLMYNPRSSTTVFQFPE